MLVSLRNFYDSLSRRLRRRRIERKGWLWFFGWGVIFVLSAVAVSAWYSRSDNISEWFRGGGQNIALAMGLRLEGITIAGVRYVPQEDVARILGTIRGEALPFIDITALREALEALGWVERATVTRLYPSRLHIAVVERVPQAIWQYAGRHYLISGSGEVIGDRILSDFESLPLVVGAGANHRLADLELLLSEITDLRGRIRASSWVGERRWNLYFRNLYFTGAESDGDIVVKLPSRDADLALRRLSYLAREALLLEHEGLQSIDLRFADRIIVRLKDGAEWNYSPELQALPQQGGA